MLPQRARRCGKAPLHPDSLRCATADKDALLDEQFARQARRPVPANVTWRLTPAPPGQPLFADKFDYPVRPTHRLQLDFSNGPLLKDLSPKVKDEVVALLKDGRRIDAIRPTAPPRARIW